LLRAAGAERVSVRIPRFAIVGADAPGADRVTPLLTRVITAAGAAAVRLHAPGRQLAAALSAIEADALVIVGGAGEGRHDRSVLALAGAGELLLHGMGIRPGESAGLGRVGVRPVLLLPRRLDAALAAWLLVGRRILTRLSKQEVCEPLPQARLIRKIVSTIGLAEMVLIEGDGSSAWPLASGIFPLSAVGRAAGWVLVPPESEGYPEGALVDVNALP
jgi:molybdopterin biosynthesis enzyme